MIAGRNPGSFRGRASAGALGTAWLILVLSGCGHDWSSSDGDDTPGPDESSDGQDVFPEIENDTVTEVGADADAELDVPPDSGPDADADADADGDDGGLPDDTVTPRNTGEPCETDPDCLGPGAFCLVFVDIPSVGTVSFPNGYCSSSCDTGGDCGSGGYCLDLSIFGGPTGCVVACDPADPDACRTDEGYICDDFMFLPETFCTPPLTSGG